MRDQDLPHNDLDSAFRIHDPTKGLGIVIVDLRADRRERKAGLLGSGSIGFGCRDDHLVAAFSETLADCEVGKNVAIGAESVYDDSGHVRVRFP